MSRLQGLLERLAVRKVEVVLVGGYAVQAAGSSLVTQDLDVACRMTPENLLRLYSALEDLHPVHRITTSKGSFHPGGRCPVRMEKYLSPYRLGTAGLLG